MKEPLLLLGAGGHAKSCIDVIEAEGRFQIVGLIGSEEERGKEILGYKIVGTDKDLLQAKSISNHIIICIGQIKNFESRYQMFFHLKKLGFSLVSVVSPKARIARSAQIGEGTIILHNVIVNSDVKIGNNCIINTGSILEHDVRVGDHTHISTSCVLNGGVTVGDCTFVGSGTIVKETVSIGSKVIVGMASKVLKTIPDSTFFK
ncbi:MAG: acetyltransferase [Leptospira bouyouniensis]